MTIFLFVFAVFGMVLLSAYIKGAEGSSHCSTQKTHVSNLKNSNGVSTPVVGSPLQSNDIDHHWRDSSEDLKAAEINPATGMEVHGGIDEGGFHYGESPINSDISGDDFSFSDTSTSIDDNI